MKKTVNIGLLIALIGMSTSSCSLLQNKSILRGDSGTATENTVVSQGSDAIDKAVSKDKADKKKKNKNKGSVFTESITGKLNGEWVIVQAGKSEIKKDEDMPYVNFEEESGKFYAFNGCNVLNGTFVVTQATEIDFNNVLSTMKYCPDNTFEQPINSVLADGVSVRTDLEQKGQETYLTLKSQTGETLLVLRRHNMEQLNGKWLVKKIDNMAVNNPEINLFLDIPELAIHGNTGCNYFNGSILIDPSVDSSISFSQMGVTMRMCENSDIEIALLVALEQTTNYRISHKTLQFLNAEGKHLIILERPEK